MAQAYAFLTLRAHSGIHAGSGQDLGVIDLPIQRERTTSFPVIRGSSLKGALRQAVEDNLATSGAAKPSLVKRLFGPDTRDAEQAGEHAGALTVGDARLLLFPVRSLAGVFAWITCPFVVERLRRDAEGVKSKAIEKPFTQFAMDRAVLAREGSAIEVGNNVVLEDFAFEKMIQPLTLCENLRQFGLSEADTQARLAMVQDDVFQNFATFATEVLTRVHLDDERKTVKRGQLWTEELLPAESVLVALLVCANSREAKRKEKNQREEPAAPSDGLELLLKLKESVGERLQIGGNETVGYGLCEAHWSEPCEVTREPKKPETNQP